MEGIRVNTDLFSIPAMQKVLEKIDVSHIPITMVDDEGKPKDNFSYYVFLQMLGEGKETFNEVMHAITVGTSIGFDFSTLSQSEIVGIISDFFGSIGAGLKDIMQQLQREQVMMQQMMLVTSLKAFPEMHGMANQNQ